jgi:hypothetical protein
MSQLTNRLYRDWLARNHRGMGAVAPMQAQRVPSKPLPRVRPATPAQVVATRPEKPVLFISE